MSEEEKEELRNVVSKLMTLSAAIRADTTVIQAEIEKIEEKLKSVFKLRT